MAIAVVGVGAVASGAAAITPPFHASTAAGHIVIGIGESVGGEAYPGAAGFPPTGWAHVTGSPNNVDTSTRLTAIWKRIVGGDTAPSWGDSGNHNVGRTITFSGVKTTGDPWNVAPTSGQETAADTSAEFPTLTTLAANCMIVFCIATGRDGLTGAQMGALTGGTGLTNATERMDDWIATGTGGGIGMITADKASAGSIGSPTAAMGSTDSKALITIALEEAVAAEVMPKPPIIAPSAAVHRAANW